MLGLATRGPSLCCCRAEVTAALSTLSLVSLALCLSCPYMQSAIDAVRRESTESGSTVKGGLDSALNGTSPSQPAVGAQGDEILSGGTLLRNIVSFCAAVQVASGVSRTRARL